MTSTQDSLDARLMRRALQLAHQGRYLTAPNPRVGCVIAQPSQDPGQPLRIIGEGYHHQAGRPHAEREALAQCSEDPRGATLYVNLEPCCHHGRTPPCTDAVLEAGIARVVAATLDPFDEVRGQGVALLRERGVEVSVGVLEDEARFENRFFMHFHERGWPWTILKSAVSLDGKCATASGDSKWITSEAARAHVHQSRSEVDAILAGIGTILADDPTMTARPESLGPDEFHQPLRVVLDPNLEIPLSSKLIETRDQSPVWVFCSEGVPTEKIENLHQLDIRVSPVPCKQHMLDLPAVLGALAADNVQSLWIEGGPRIHTAFLEAQLVNEAHIYIAPKLIGGSGAPSFFMGQGAATMKEAQPMEHAHWQILGDDALLQGVLRRQLP
ncbi:MAG: bifunctional diaminohydroxyphosphoribosylaminopyrimidine deaminase/5-amino-6-(5-phosphoribosylamino)uracil reductase RibD [Candidatus Hinthialibacter antarcticus]|nr:bifunctional diaminohydroxyphosphoribosylaminopyrimidine deaminase/5-amino-6-(5-phosphoribosylamino)uracil reductase RibD [Candidatus Hinthialibacter antarcticus]